MEHVKSPTRNSLHICRSLAQQIFTIQDWENWMLIDSIIDIDFLFARIYC